VRIAIDRTTSAGPCPGPPPAGGAETGVSRVILGPASLFAGLVGLLSLRVAGVAARVAAIETDMADSRTVLRSRRPA